MIVLWRIYYSVIVHIDPLQLFDPPEDLAPFIIRNFSDSTAEDLLFYTYLYASSTGL